MLINSQVKTMVMTKSLGNAFSKHTIHYNVQLHITIEA